MTSEGDGRAEGKRREMLNGQSLCYNGQDNVAAGFGRPGFPALPFSRGLLVGKDRHSVMGHSFMHPVHGIVVGAVHR